MKLIWRGIGLAVVATGWIAGGIIMSEMLGGHETACKLSSCIPACCVIFGGCVFGLICWHRAG